MTQEKSKLVVVRDGLKADPRITIVDGEIHNHFPNPNGFWSQTVDFIIAPVRGIYTAAGLQGLMETLVPGLQPTMMDRFTSDNVMLELGKLYFDEVIGIQSTRIEVRDADPDFVPNLHEGTTFTHEVPDQTLKRRTWVRLFPNREIAAIRDRFPYSIHMRKIEEFHRRDKTTGFVGQMGTTNH